MTPAAEVYRSFVTPAAAKVLEGPFASTCLVDGKPVACAGIANKWLDSWLAWAYFDAAAGKHMLAVTRAICKRFDDLPKGRIEAATPIDFPAGRRWLEMLGFELETPNGMRHYTPDGRTFALYSRVN
jgi:hypothetical protein